jgi:hypothetical protein
VLDWQYGAISVRAAWWGDVLGRRHWYVEGASLSRRMPPATQGPFEGELREGEHPLAYIAPPLSFLWRTHDGQREPAVVCRCGFVGTPESLGWAGECCGPCFDREQEGLPPLGLPPWRRELGPFDHFVLAPDGKLVSLRFETQSGQRGTPVIVRVWSPPYTGQPLWRRSWGDSFNSAVAVNGRYIALLLARRLTLLTLDDSRTTDSRAMEELAGSTKLAFAGQNGERLLALTSERLTAWAVNENGKLGERLYSEPVPRRLHGRMVIGPYGQRALLHDFSVRDTGTGQVVERLDMSGRTFDSGVIAPDGTVLIEGHLAHSLGLEPCWVGRWPAGQREERRGFWDWLVGRPPRKPALMEAGRSHNETLALSPDGGMLGIFAANVGGGLGVDILDAHKLHTIAEYQLSEPGMGGPTPAFTADGQLLVLTRRGLAVYPWRELVGRK